jgi:hypothetical protein
MWDFKFSRRRVWCSELPSGIYCRVKWLSTDVTHPWWWRQYAPLKRRSTIILHGSISQKTVSISDDGGSTHLWNVGRQSFYTAVYPRRQLWRYEWDLKLLQRWICRWTCGLWRRLGLWIGLSNILSASPECLNPGQRRQDVATLWRRWCVSAVAK